MCACGNGYQWNANYTYCDQVPVYGADDFLGDVANIINTAQGNTGSTNTSGCTPGRTAAEQMINQALGCSGSGSDNTGQGWTNTGYGGDGSGQTTTTQMTGYCQGTISASPQSGRAGVPFTITVNIAQANMIGRVTSDNPACHNCDLSASGYGTWTRTLYFTGSPS
jgi:hypothetical protein